MSKVFGPGWIALLKGTGSQLTLSFVKPSFCATAYAVAASRPWPLVGSPSSQGEPEAAGWSGSKYGGYAGLSAPTVSVPGVSVARLAAAHASGVAATVAAALGTCEAWLPELNCGDAPGEEQAATTSVRTSVAKVRVDRSIASSSG